ncbi:MAG: UTP--glucose-1-phosphate uridylyltransferase GalU [Candidatus Pacebacteria bacterium]|nr:UTP--glucose-1-phosphate uridylyltransferase GalU [Candidatus Paceibacterota bacterium]
MFKPVRKAIFPVGGLGTRFLPATKAMPKEMLPVVDKPLIQYAVEEARAAGIEEFIFVTGRGKSSIEDHFDYSSELKSALHSKGKDILWRLVESTTLPPGKVAYTRQPEPLGLGHAVWCAKPLIGDEPFAVILADDLIQSDIPCLQQMIAAYQQVGGAMVAVMEVPMAHTDRYGIVSFDPSHAATGSRRLVKVTGLVEKPRVDLAPSNLAVIGRYILDPRVFALLDEQKRGAGGEIQLTDALSGLLPIMPFHGYRFAGRRFDCGDKAGFVEATVAFAMSRDDLGDDLAARLRPWIDS